MRHFFLQPIKSQRAGAVALSAVASCLLLVAPVEAKVTYTTFDAGLVTAINSENAVTGYNATQGFVRAADGTMTLFDVPGGSTPQAWAINDTGTVTGFYYLSGGTAGFIRAADGTITTFSARGASGTQPYSMNNKGAIVGRYYDDAGSHGFLRAAGGRIRTIEVSGAMETDLVSINDRGTISGSYLDNDDHYHGFLRASDGTITSFDVPGANSTFGGYVNINGAAAGYYGDNKGEHGFVRASDGMITTFDYPGCILYSAGINRHDVVTGVCQESDNPNHFFGFLRRPDARISLFHVPNGGASTIATGINDSGVTAGYYKLGGFLRFP